MPDVGPGMMGNKELLAPGIDSAGGCGCGLDHRGSMRGINKVASPLPIPYERKHKLALLHFPSHQSP